MANKETDADTTKKARAGGASTGTDTAKTLAEARERFLSLLSKATHEYLGNVLGSASDLVASLVGAKEGS